MYTYDININIIKIKKMIIMESCIKCRKSLEISVKDKVFEEIREFIKDPNNFYVIINPITGFYKFEKIKKVDKK